MKNNQKPYEIYGKDTINLKSIKFEKVHHF